MKVSEIIKKCSEFKKKEERVLALRANGNNAVKTILKYMFDNEVKFLLPEGNPPFKPCQFDEPNLLHAEARTLYLFVDGGNPNLSQTKRESLFIDLLQSVPPEDAELLIAMKDKKSPYKGLTKDVVMAAFPELFPT